MNKTFNNSREGNDCYIDDRWYWCELWGVALRKLQLIGYEDKPQYYVHKDNTHMDMPDEVKKWFGA